MSEIVVGKSDSGRKLRKWFTVRNIVVALAVVLLAAGAGVGVRWWQTKNSHATMPPKTKTKAQAAQDIALSGQFDTAQQFIADELKKPNLSADDKFQLYFQQGANYQNKGDLKSALESFKNAARVKESQSLYESMAVVSKELGDTAGAITYYKKAIQLINSNSPLADEYKEANEQLIRELGGTP